MILGAWRARRASRWGCWGLHFGWGTNEHQPSKNPGTQDSRLLAHVNHFITRWPVRILQSSRGKPAGPTAVRKSEMDDDEYGDADDILADLVAAQPGPSRPPQPRPAAPSPRIQQPTPQRLDRAPPSNASASGPPPKVVQPTPQALPARGSGSAILVSPRQKGNPVLACLKSVPWEYSDIPADYGLGQTTCALFLR